MLLSSELDGQELSPKAQTGFVAIGIFNAKRLKSLFHGSVTFSRKCQYEYLFGAVWDDGLCMRRRQWEAKVLIRRD